MALHFSHLTSAYSPKLLKLIPWQFVLGDSRNGCIVCIYLKSGIGCPFWHRTHESSSRIPVIPQSLPEIHSSLFEQIPLLLEEVFVITTDKTETWAEYSCSWLKELKGGVQELCTMVFYSFPEKIMGWKQSRINRFHYISFPCPSYMSFLPSLWLHMQLQSQSAGHHVHSVTPVSGNVLINSLEHMLPVSSPSLRDRGCYCW